MSDEIDNGGPAFPITAGEQVYATGATMRDWFAGQALSALVHPHAASILREAAAKGTVGREMANPIAQAAYDIADAILADRKVTGGAA